MQVSAIWKAAALGISAVLVFGAAVILGFEVATADRIAPGVSVLEVPVGGLTIEEATARLAPRTQSIMDQQLVLQLGDRHWDTSVRALGVRMDSARLAQAAYSIGHD